MKPEARAVDITIMGREFRVACPEGEEGSLKASVEHLNRKMREIRDSGKVVGNERIAIMAALNITHEFMTGKAGFDTEDFRRRIGALQAVVDDALREQDKLF